MKFTVNFDGSTEELEGAVGVLRGQSTPSSPSLPVLPPVPQIEPEIPPIVVEALRAHVEVAKQSRLEIQGLVQSLSQLVHLSRTDRTELVQTRTETIDAAAITVPQPIPQSQTPVLPASLTREFLYAPVRETIEPEFDAPPPLPIPVQQADIKLDSRDSDRIGACPDLDNRPDPLPKQTGEHRKREGRSWTDTLLTLVLLSAIGGMLGLIWLRSVESQPSPTPSPSLSPQSDSKKPQAVAKKSNPSKLVLPTDELFKGGSNSLVAKAVGSAEGTRTPEGAMTWAYYGHEDPGNGVWNKGSFSYQHGASSPQEADDKQLRRLRGQFDVILGQAASKGLKLGLDEQINGIDLANQAPLAALESGGYVDRLYQFRTMDNSFERIVQSRTYSFLNPVTNRWEAPGLGNTYDGISRDQRRRADAIDAAIKAYQKEINKR